MTPQDKLLELLKKQKEEKDMRTAMGLVDNFTRKVKMVEGEKGEKGTDGYTPLKGKDYFTQNEIDSIIKFVQSKVRNGENGKDGKNPLTISKIAPINPNIGDLWYKN